MSIIYLPLEKAINFYLRLDPGYQEKLAPLATKTMQLEIKPLNLYFQFNSQAIRILDSYEETPDTVLRGHPLTLLTLATNQDASQALFENDMTISGDIELGQQVQALFLDLDIDWEEHLSQITGDIAAHELTTFFKRSTTFAKKTAHNMQLNLSEFLQEELSVLPPKEEMSDFFNDVDRLKLRFDRLHARVHRLSKKLEA